MSKRYFIAAVFVAALFGGLISLVSYRAIFEKKEADPTSGSASDNQKFRLSNFLSDSGFSVPDGLNFVVAAKVVTPCVVHIKSTLKGSDGGSSSDALRQMFPDFFDQDQKEYAPVAMGSGVIISEDGYIVTNFHVVENAGKIEITLNDNTRYEAKIIGTDPATDLALVKIAGSNLPMVKLGDSDNLQIGEWVLAIGNPFELTSTVTAGIVSAKARNINILNNRPYGVESFIQTDAAVNPGNSGGALVNLRGELVGINTAIATKTGSYNGYSFAVPVSLVKKVVSDLIEFGTVQRALLGIGIQNVDADFAEEHKIDLHSGVYVGSVQPGSSAEDAGLKIDDIIIRIDGNDIANVSELQETVARKRPGEKISITFIRDGKKHDVATLLKNVIGDVSVVKKESSAMVDGALFADLNDDLKEKLHLDGGVQLKNIRSKKWSDAGVKEGFIITHVDKQPVQDLEELSGLISGKSSRYYFLEGVYPDGHEEYYRINNE